MKIKDIRSQSLDDLLIAVTERGLPRYRASQIHEWLWKKGAHSFDAMSNLPLDVRVWLTETYSFPHIGQSSSQYSNDGTIKNAVQLHDGLVVESVLIPTETRTTACVSSQVGCSLNCEFCATARLKRMRNLEPHEIYDQVIEIDRQSRDKFKRPLSNIVFMGMGEPLMNYNNVIAAIDKITSDQGLNMAARRITLSTSGVPKLIKKLADERPRFKLALSLHSAIDETRTKIMPFNEQFPLHDIKEALKYWYEKTRSRITYEYVVWKEINDDDRHIQALVNFCKHVPCKVNLIEYNSIDDERFVQADPTVIETYIQQLTAYGIVCKVRRSRGRDIDAACGQLANKAVAE